MKAILTVAGSDSSGGAGIQADIKTITMHGMYAMSAITAVTAQNTLGVAGVWEASEEQVREQIARTVEDIPPDAVKVGMVCSREQIQAIGEEIRRWELKNVVADTVMASTSGTRFLKEQARDTERAAAPGPPGNPQPRGSRASIRYGDPLQRGHGAGSQENERAFWDSRPPQGRASAGGGGGCIVGGRKGDLVYPGKA